VGRAAFRFSPPTWFSGSGGFAGSAAINSSDTYRRRWWVTRRAGFCVGLESCVPRR